MDFQKNGIVVSISDQVIQQLVLERLRDERPPPSVVNNVLVASAGILPRIGAEVAELGGVFAGVVRGASGEADYYLIVGPEAPSGLPWQKAIDWASSVTNLGFADFSLFNRREQSICYGNVPELFQKEWYWSSEQFAGREACAWVQYFGDGLQDFTRKGYDYRARAVRRVPLQ